MKNTMIIVFSVLLSNYSYAVLDDNLGSTFTTKNNSKKVVAVKTFKKTVKSKNDRKLIAKTLNDYKKALVSNFKTTRKPLGAVPLHIQENWDSLNQDQKEIVYSYHNENPYAQIGKAEIARYSRPNSEYVHDTAYGFDSNKQQDLDSLRADINGSSKEHLSEEDQKVLDTLAAIEAE